MRKIIMFIFFLLSLITLIAFTYAIQDLISFFSLEFDFNEIASLFRDKAPLDEILPALGVILWGLFQLYGIPLLVFLVSWNGLAIKKN